MNFEVIKLETEQNVCYHVTPLVDELIAKSGVTEGICVISTPHTTAGLCNHSFWDPKGWHDMMIDIKRAIPSRIDFKYDSVSPVTAAATVKSAIMGSSMTMIIIDGKLKVGSSNGVLFAEFDGPATREIHVAIM